jgi:3-methylfumaryl-CoA hydratase
VSAGISAEADVYVDPAPVSALASLFDDGLPTPGVGDALPPLWHWAALARWAPAGQLGADGHPRTGGFLPALGKPRRMFAGGSVEFHAPLHLGAPIRRRDTVLSVTTKTGRQGEFVLVEVETLVFTSGGTLALTETQDLIYRDRADIASTAQAHRPADPAKLAEHLISPGDDGQWQFQTDPVRLMRFSSATRNGHRIHYDWPYARGIEGYPGLVVHGPLMTLAMAEVLRLRSCTGVRRITHRASRPLFCGTPATIRVDVRDGGPIELALSSDAGSHATLTVEA